jgi:hypothetical protein
MDRETVEQIWSAAERERGRYGIDFLFLIDTAAAMAGPLKWRDVAELALRLPRNEAAQPLQLLEFIAELAHSLRPRSVLDPWVVAPTILAAAHEASGSSRSRGLVRVESVWRVAERIAPLDWRLGDPLDLLRDLSPERFDLVLVAPPMAMRGQAAPEPDDPRGRVEIGDLVLWRAAQMVAAHGAVLFHTSDNFFWAKSRRKLWAGIAERGLHPRAVVSVDPALASSWLIATSLVLFTQEVRDQLFVGRLERGTSVPALVSNLMAERTDDDPQLGVLTRSESFRGWGPLMLEQELARMFGSSELRPLTDIGHIRSVQLRPDGAYDPPANCVFVPTLGFGNVGTAPPDLTGKGGYKVLVVALDPEVAQAEYVAGLLSSPPGRQLRESVSTGTGVLHLSATGAEVIRLPVPPISVQMQAVRSAAQLASMEATVARLRDQLWRRPQEAGTVLAQLEASAKADPVRRWLDTLPYPLASVLQRFSALRDPREQLDELLHFYEATAQFSCAVLLSILRADPDLLAFARPEIARVVGRRGGRFDRAEFGLWTTLGRALAHTITRISERRELRPRLEEAVGPAAELMAQLAGERIWQVLDQARGKRNIRVHGGVLPLIEIESRIATLEVLLSNAEQAVGSGFEDIDLARADQGRLTRGLHVYPRAQRLRGPSGVFDEFELKTRVDLESGHLVFVGRDVDISSVLMLVPLVRIGGATEISRNACYFFNGRADDGRFKYVSYHFEDEAELDHVEEPELQELLADLTAQ